MEIKKINNETYWCCPHCGAELMSNTANSSRTASGTYVFFDGDTIQADTADHPIFTDTNFLSSLDIGVIAKVKGTTKLHEKGTKEFGVT